MGKVIWHEAGPDDPIYKEGWRRYSPHWAKNFGRRRRIRQAIRLELQTNRPASGKETQPIKPTTSRWSK